MCVSCVLQVSRAYTFRQTCRRSEETLQSLLAASKLDPKKESPIADENACDVIDNELMIATDILPITIEVDENQSAETSSIDSQQVTTIDEKLVSFDELSVKDESIEVDTSLLSALADEIKTSEFHITHECSICSSSFDSYDELQTHIKSMHAITTISDSQQSDLDENFSCKQKFECPECHKCFGENKIL